MVTFILEMFGSHTIWKGVLPAALLAAGLFPPSVRAADLRPHGRAIEFSAPKDESAATNLFSDGPVSSAETDLPDPLLEWCDGQATSGFADITPSEQAHPGVDGQGAGETSELGVRRSR